MIFAFLIVTMVGVGNIQIANIYFWGNIILKKLFLSEKLSKYDERLFLLSLLLCWISISTICFLLYEESKIESRYVIKYIYALQYMVLIIPLNISSERFEKRINVIAVFLSAYIIGLFLYLYCHDYYFLMNGISTRLWACDYVFGWPNSIPIPLLFALWISFKNKYSLFSKIIIVIAIYLTFSRGALVGIIIIIGYFIYNAKSIRKYKKAFAIISIIIMALALFFFKDPVLKKFYFTDRLDIYKYTLSYIKQRPWVGYGGNTLYQINDTVTDYQPIYKWPHTHNWLLEITIRYGIIGAFIFLTYLFSIYKRIENRNHRFMFLLLLFMALFQTFMQEFVFIFILSYLANNNILKKTVSLSKR